MNFPPHALFLLNIYFLYQVCYTISTMSLTFIENFSVTQKESPMIEERYLAHYMKSLEAPLQIEDNFRCCEMIAQALAYPRNIPKDFRNYITTETDFLFYKTFNLPYDQKLTKKDFRQMQKELAKRIVEELASPTYFVSSIGAFEYFSLFHALKLLKVSNLKLSIPNPERSKNFGYKLAYGLFMMDDATKTFPEDGYFVCDQFYLALKHQKKELTEK